MIESSFEWSPVYAWAQENHEVHTRISVASTMFTNTEKDRFEISLKMYSGSNEPIWTYKDEDYLQGLRHRQLLISDILKNVGKNSADGLLVILVKNPDKAATERRLHLEPWMEYFDNGGKFLTRFPALYGPEEEDPANWPRYQFAPGIVSNQIYSTGVILLNTTNRPRKFKLIVYDKGGSTISSPQMEVPPMDVYHSFLEEVIPNVGGLLAKTGGIGSLLIDGHGLLSYFMFKSRITGTITSIDHTMAFGYTC
jgi:hypothetical protein